MVQVWLKDLVSNPDEVVSQVKSARCQYGTSNFLTQFIQVTIMQFLTHQKLQSIVPVNKWLRRIYTAGFVFFLAKGLVWIVAAVWVFY